MKQILHCPVTITDCMICKIVTILFVYSRSTVHNSSQLSGGQLRLRVLGSSTVVDRGVQARSLGVPYTNIHVTGGK